MSRVLLSKNIQILLCSSAKEKSELSWYQLARYLEVKSRAFENWYRGIYLLPEEIFIKLNSISGLNLKDYKLVSDNWGRVKGGRASIKQQGGSFWTLEGSTKGGTNSAKKILLPKYSKDLAEFIGIMLGDGGISRDQINVTLGYSTDKKYVPYIKGLIRKLFRIKTSIYRSRSKDFIRIRASGVNLVKNLLKLGLIQGNKIKQQFDIPIWIKKKDEYISACIRGMIDTDGCVHRKVRRELNGIEYRSIGITFCSASRPLQISLVKLFNILGFKVAISGRTIYLCGKEQIERYIKEIGFSNPKHLKRYKNFRKDYEWKKFSPENCLKLPATV